MPQSLSREQQIELARLLLLFNLSTEKTEEIVVAIDNSEKLRLFLDKLSERNYEATPEEVYQLSGEAVLEAKYG